MSVHSNGVLVPFLQERKETHAEHRSIQLRFMPVEVGVQLSKTRLNLCREMADNEDVTLEIANR